MPHLVGPGIGEPDIVLGVDGETMGHDKTIRTPGTQELTAESVKHVHGIFPDPVFRKLIRPGATGTVKNEDMIMRINPEAAGLSERGPAELVLPVNIKRVGIG